MKKSQILYKAVTERFILLDNEYVSPLEKQRYLCLAVYITDRNTTNMWNIRETIAEDVVRNKNHSLFSNSLGKRNQMQVAMYGLFLSEYFKDIE